MIWTPVGLLLILLALHFWFKCQKELDKGNLSPFLLVTSITLFTFGLSCVLSGIFPENPSPPKKAFYPSKQRKQEIKEKIISSPKSSSPDMVEIRKRHRESLKEFEKATELD